MIILPLILTSVMLGIVNAKSLETLKLMAVKLLPYFTMTTMIAILMGFFVANWIEPGAGLSQHSPIGQVQVAGENDAERQLSRPDPFVCCLY